MDFAEILQEVRRRADCADLLGLRSNWAVAIQLTGDTPGVFTLALRQGKVALLPTRHPHCQATISLSCPTFLGILSGRVNPVIAFMGGRVRVHGDLSAAMDLRRFAKKT